MKGLLTSLLTVLTFTSLQAQGLTTMPPRLVIGLTIDQLRSDYMQAFSSLYGEHGLKRLMKEGRFYRNAYYNFANPDEASSIASLYTGADPAVNGIIGNRWLDRSTLISREAADDSGYIGFYTDDNSSPEQLLVSTFTDELKIATGGKALVFSLSSNRNEAIFGAGHAGDLALWLNDGTAKWCSSTYYKNFPAYVTTYNTQQGLDKTISKLVWSPVLPAWRYKYLTTEWTEKPFSYKMEDKKAVNGKYLKVKSSPFVNDEINQMLSVILQNEPLGLDNIPDVLSLTYYAGNYDHQSARELPMEMQDTYVRLDQSVAQLLDMIDKKVGLRNTLIFVTSTGYTDSDQKAPAEYHIPSGDFHIERCSALLNMYLNVIYGQGTYVEAYDGLQIYLNHKLIESKKLTLRDVTDKAIDFLRQFSGVSDVYSSYSFITASAAPEVEYLRNAYNRLHSGDLEVSVLPGWTVINPKNSLDTKNIRNAYMPAPLILLGADVKPAIIDTSVSLDRLAPTISSSLRIRAPNGCGVLPIEDVYKIENNRN